jgi:hypothetical protein
MNAYQLTVVLNSASDSPLVRSAYVYARSDKPRRVPMPYTSQLDANSAREGSQASTAVPCSGPSDMPAHEGQKRQLSDLDQAECFVQRFEVQ